MSMQERYVGFDWLRFIAAIGIVGCHLALPNMTDGAWWIKRFTDLNVGVFAAIAGFFMANSLQQKEVQFVSFVTRRVKRLLVPLYLWPLFYIGIDLIFDTLASKPLTFQPCSLRYWYSILICGNAATQTWFLVALFYTQVLLFLGVKKNFFTQSHIGSLILLLLSIFGIYISHKDGWWTYYFLRLFSFFLLGIVIFRERILLQKIPMGIIYGCLLLGFILIAFGFRFGFLGECVLSIPMLLWGLNWKTKSIKIGTFGHTLGGFSFGIYLIHPLFTRMMGVGLVMFNIPSTALVFIVDVVLVTLFSILAIGFCYKQLVKRCPKLKVIFPI